MSGRQRPAQRVAVAALAMVMSGCGRPRPPADIECQSSDECIDGWFCRESACVKICNTCHDCPTKVHACEQNACIEMAEPGCQVDADCDDPGECQSSDGTCCGGACLYPLEGCGAACAGAICEAAGAECGEVQDVCGGAVSCGECGAPDVCGTEAGPNLCGCASAARLCADRGKNCDTLSAVDNCGVERTINCGTCPWPTICGGGGIPNLCSSGTCEPEDDPSFCSRHGKECGTASGLDNCAAFRIADCGSCQPPACCGCGPGDTGTPNLCGEGTCLISCGDKNCREDDDCGAVCRPGSGCCERNCDGLYCGGDDACAGTCTQANSFCCTDECVPGQTRCANASSIESCGPYDADACRDFGGATSCGSGVCYHGGCCTPDCAGKTCGDDDGCGGQCDTGAGCCTDECNPGQTRCSQTLLQTCNTGGVCRVWNAPASCGGTQVCYQNVCCTPRCRDAHCDSSDGCGGICAAGSGCCDDDCASGDTSCASAAQKTCGYFDADPCWDWSSPSSCGGGICHDAQVCVETCSGQGIAAIPGTFAAGNSYCNRDRILVDDGHGAVLWSTSSTMTVVDGQSVGSCIVVDFGGVCSPSQICVNFWETEDPPCSGDNCGGACVSCTPDVGLFTGATQGAWEHQISFGAPGTDIETTQCSEHTGNLRYMLVCRLCPGDSQNLEVDWAYVVP